LDDAQKEAEQLCATLGVERKDEVARAARWHDWGKLHPAFQGMLKGVDVGCVQGGPWAKSAKKGRPRYVDDQKRERSYFRHELASALSFLAKNEYVSKDEIDLTAFLIAAHHGKVRMGLRSLPDEKEPPEKGRLFARGVWGGDRLPPYAFTDGEGVAGQELKLDLMQIGEGSLGPSWTARMQGLLKRHGPFRLAWWEAMVRLADWRASRKEEES
jgi:CRISPR-associated endonuclease/helicase Cas3